MTAHIGHLASIIGVPDTGCPRGFGTIDSIDRRGLGRYRIGLPGRPTHVELAVAGERRHLLVFVEATFHDGLTLEVWTLSNERTDLREGEEIRVAYAIAYAPGEKMTDRHPATPEKLSGAVICTTPGYNGVFHIEPDPPDLAERRAARVAEHQRREMQERAARGAVHAAATRPDGFDQHQVDAAKAALLAPAPPRYPRRTR